MIQIRFSLILLAALAKLVASAPAALSASPSATTESASDVPSSTVSAALSVTTVPFASTNPNAALWNTNSSDSVPSPQRGTLGAPYSWSGQHTYGLGES
ncbi:hypothetical protein BT96DRAFT_120404 [Gymnopus androsaceus JB14]|uniref:Uncharacterized protein n=1 Tax=Gymnopus androsaceus JB14 TaxID=1447944 RepID=A0A6A4GCB5_9AGAR|nr:hypothetical protein BT96DRAFT_120404 [Gymnopus androsaceus JB14]